MPDFTTCISNARINYHEPTPASTFEQQLLANQSVISNCGRSYGLAYTSPEFIEAYRQEHERAKFFTINTPMSGDYTSAIDSVFPNERRMRYEVGSNTFMASVGGLLSGGILSYTLEATLTVTLGLTVGGFFLMGGLVYFISTQAH